MTGLSIGNEIVVAMAAMKPTDQELIDPRKAEAVVTSLSEIRKHETDSGCAIRYALSEHCVGAGNGNEKRRQRIFGAYWKLLRRVLDNRERTTRRVSRRRAA